MLLVSAALQFALSALLGHKFFHQAATLKYASLAANVLARDRFKDYFMRLLIHFDPNSSTVFDIELSSYGRGNYDLPL